MRNNVRFKFLNILLKEKNTIRLGNTVEEMTDILKEYFKSENITEINFKVEEVYSVAHAWKSYVTGVNESSKNIFRVSFTDKAGNLLSSSISYTPNLPNSYIKNSLVRSLIRKNNTIRIDGNVNFSFYIGNQFQVSSVSENSLEYIIYGIDKGATLKDAIMSHYNSISACDIYDTMMIYYHHTKNKKYNQTYLYNKITKLYRPYLKKFKYLKFAGTNINMLIYVYEFIHNNKSTSGYQLLKQMKNDNIISDAIII